MDLSLEKKWVPIARVQDLALLRSGLLKRVLSRNL